MFPPRSKHTYVNSGIIVWCDNIRPPYNFATVYFSWNPFVSKSVLKCEYAGIGKHRDYVDLN